MIKRKPFSLVMSTRSIDAYHSPPFRQKIGNKIILFWGMKLQMFWWNVENNVKQNRMNSKCVLWITLGYYHFKFNLNTCSCFYFAYCWLAAAILYRIKYKVEDVSVVVSLKLLHWLIWYFGKKKKTQICEQKHHRSFLPFAGSNNKNIGLVASWKHLLCMFCIHFIFL